MSIAERIGLTVLGALAVSQGAAAQTFSLVSDPANAITTDPAPPAGYYGAAWIDYDGDGDLDLFANDDFLYRNEGGGAFVKITDSGLADAQQNGGGGFDAQGTSWADYDNDGDLDAFLSGRVSFLYRNEGDGTFSQVTDGDLTDGFANRGWACAFADYDNDGNVDLSITHPATFVAGGSTPNHLFHNDGPPSYTFTKILTTPISMGLDSYTVGTWSDYDDDGDADHFIGSGPANGTTQPDNLYENQLTETGTADFVVISESPIATDQQDGQLWNWIDYDNDGDLDAYVTNWGGSLGGIANRLYQQQPDGTFVGITGQTIVTDADISLASVWADFDNDGDLDCYVGNDGSNVDRYYVNGGDGTFTRDDASALVQAAEAHRSASAGDYDDDGDLDLFVNGPSGARKLFRNDTPGGNHWVNLTLVGTTSNHTGVGAKVRVKATIGGEAVWQLRELSAQNSFNGHSSLRVHVGLGDAATIDSLVVTWPSGVIDVDEDVAADGFLTLIESSGVVAVEPGGVTGAGLRARVHPNPFRARTAVSFDLSETRLVRVLVHDAAGRRVRELAAGTTFAAGTHVVSWDGRNDAGERLASGAYFYRVEAGDAVATGRLTILR